MTALTPARWTAITVLRAEVRASLQVAKRVVLPLTPSLEWDPKQRGHNVTGVDGQAAVVAPHAIRPGLSLSVEWP